MYRLGWPFSAMLAALGMPLSIKIDVVHDDGVGVYIGTSEDLIGLVAEAMSFEELKSEVKLLVPELLSHQSHKSGQVPVLIFK
ncbi:MAG TPA: DUF1902 domain-containing protein [Candidatus Acidoferrum sp.]|nr:DUF1902 domain-containing protein [Candidatus Acidoferrum sp.]